MNQVHARLANDHEELHALLVRLAEDVEAPECGGKSMFESAGKSRVEP